MSIFLTTTVVLLSIAAAVGVLVGLVFFAESSWRRSATANVMGDTETILREQPAPERAAA